jgi:transcriptional regulator with XRE-family HTH domain
MDPDLFMGGGQGELLRKPPLLSPGEREARLTWKAEAARLLDEVLPWGERKRLARAIGISPQELSALLNPRSPRAPHVDTAWGIAAYLRRRGVPAPLIQELAACLIMASPERAAILWDAGVPESWTPAELVEEVDGLLLFSGREPLYDLRLERAMHLIGVLEELASRLSPRDSWAPLVRAAQAVVWGFMAGMANGLDRLEQALRWGRMARRLAEGLLERETLLDPWMRRRLGDRIYAVGRWILWSLGGECSAYYNLGCPRYALEVLERSVRWDDRLAREEACAPLYPEFREGRVVARLAYASAADGLSCREIRELYRAGDRFVQSGGPSHPDSFDAGLRRYAAWAVLRGGSASRPARRWARGLLDPVLQRRMTLDPLGRVLVLRAWGELRWQDGEREEAFAAIREAIREAEAARLFNQLAKIRRDWGSRPPK